MLSSSRTEPTSPPCWITLASSPHTWSVSRGRARSRSTSPSSIPTACVRSSSGRRDQWIRIARRGAGGDLRGGREAVGGKGLGALSEWETAYWADGPGQPADRVPEVRAKVHDWVLTNYLAEKEEGRPQVLDPPAAGRLGELKAPLLVVDRHPGRSRDAGVDASPGRGRSLHARLEVFEGVAHMLNLERAGALQRLAARVPGRNRRRLDTLPRLREMVRMPFFKRAASELAAAGRFLDVVGRRARSGRERHCDGWLR